VSALKADLVDDPRAVSSFAATAEFTFVVDM
jgi:hypothetical protein